MALFTVEGTVENGRIRLRDDVALPEHATVYVVVPDFATSRPTSAPPRARVISPRLARPQQAADFVKQAIDAPT